MRHLYPSHVLKQMLAMGLTVVFIVTPCQNIVLAEENSLDSHKLIERYPLYQTGGSSDESYPYYQVYLYEGQEKGYQDVAAGTEVSVNMETGVTGEGEPLPYEEGGFIWDSEAIEHAEWTFEVQQAG